MMPKRENDAAKKVAFQVGDLLQLRSGGPVMTVIGGSEPDMAEQLGTGKKRKGVWIRCAWFDGNKPLRGDFPADSLQAPETGDGAQGDVEKGMPKQ
jgi:uncharacterized protein YodC (DUF2158 family)